MTLLRKSLIFVTVVLSIQVITTIVLVNVVRLAEQRAERLAYARAVISGFSRIETGYSENIFLRILASAFGDPKIETKCGKLTDEINSTLEQLRNSKQAKAEDIKALDDIKADNDYLLAELQNFADKIKNGHSSEAFAIQSADFRSNLSPYIIRIGKKAKAFSQRHLQYEREITLTGTAMANSLLASVIAVNVLATIAYVMGFDKFVVKRLGVITENFGRFADKKPLLKRLSGHDEIAEVDNRFHTMSNIIMDAVAKDQVIFDNMPTGLITCTEEGRIMTLNPCARNWLGDSVANRLVAEFVEQAESLSELLAGRVVGSVRGHIRLSNGTMMLAELSASHFTYDGKNYAIVAAIDLSDREEKERMRQEFINILSHDIRTPITSVCLMLELIKMQVAKPENAAYERCDAAKKQLDRVVQLTSSLLDIAKCESGGINLNQDNHAAGALIEQAVEVVDMIAQKKEVEIIEEPTDLFLQCDAERIVQVLVNFLSNALKYTEPQKRIRVGAYETGSAVKMFVSDEGIGIPADQVPFVFDRFRQARASDAEQGSGLGLAICKLFVESHGGCVGVESVEGEGSTFWLEIPLKVPAIAPAST